MSEFMYSVLVPGGRRKDSCKEIAVSKVSVFVQTGWGLGLKRLTTNLQNSFQAKFQGSNPILWLRSNASTTQHAARQQEQQQQQILLKIGK